MLRRSGVDPYLSHVPDPPPEAPKPVPVKPPVKRGFSQASAFTKVSHAADTPGWVPALVRLPRPDFPIPLSIQQNFKENARIGNVMSGRGSKTALEALGQLEGVTVEVSRDGGTWELDKSLETVKGFDVAAPDGELAEDQCIVGIIDACIDPKHQAFLDRNGKTRLLFVWDQTAQAGLSPQTAGFEADYGALYSKEDITQALTQAADLNIAAQASQDERLHGTHVASIAAGRRTLDADGKPSFAGGMAPDAPLVVVIPALRAGDGKRASEGFAKSHVDALKFIDEVAKRLKLPVVVNVSAGIAAGAHDGSSTLEAGFDAFTNGGHAAGRAVVKSAGNARDADRYRRFDLPSLAQEMVQLVPPLISNGPSTVEAWFSSAHQLELTLTEGDRPASFTLSEQQNEGKLVTHQGTATLSYERYHRDNGDSLLLLSLPATDDGFLLRFLGVAVRGQGTVDLWLEGSLTLKRPTQEGTLTVPGSARTVITVASSHRDGHLIADTSSRGPTRDGRHKPELFAPGLEIRAARAGTSFDTVVLSGTSMAAPHVTGAIALCFSKAKRLQEEVPNALQVRAALIATATGMDGNWRADRGYGLLNAQAFLRAFD